MDLAGGTLDLWPLYLFHPGAVTVNFAINVLTSCRISAQPGKAIHLKSLDTGREERFAGINALCAAKPSSFRHPLAAWLVRFFAPVGGFVLETRSESPAGAGIAGSSALMIATSAALARFTNRRLSREDIRVLAQNVEAQIINVPTGCQDYYPALYGGANAVHLDPDGVHRESIPVAAEDLDERFVLVYTGAPRRSGINNWEVFKAHIDGDRRVMRNFEQISQIACAMHNALSASDWGSVARLLRDEWKLRKTNAPGISTPLIDKMIAAASKKGGVAAKACGAGGGGCVAIMVEPGARQAVAEALHASGGRVLPFRVAREGLTITALKAPRSATAAGSSSRSPGRR